MTTKVGNALFEVELDQIQKEEVLFRDYLAVIHNWS